MPDAFAGVALHVTVVVPGHLHDNTVACDRLGVGRTRQVVDIYGVYHVPDAI